jgi:hypothetical protein
MNNFKNILITGLIIILGLLLFFGGRKVTKFEDEIAFKRGENAALKAEITIRDSANSIILRKIDSLKLGITTITKENITLRAEKKQIAQERDDALAKLNGITSDSSYRFLQEIAYKFPGTLKYLFNELQVKGIHADYIRLKASVGIINSLERQVSNCDLQVKGYENINVNLENVIASLSENIGDYKKIVDNDSTIMRDQDKTIDKERRRKGFWRTSTGALILILIGVII